MRSSKLLFEIQRNTIGEALIEAKTQIVFPLRSKGKEFYEKRKWNNYMTRSNEFL